VQRTWETKNDRKKEFLTREQFHSRLIEWEKKHRDDDPELRIDGVDGYGQTDWMYVKSPTGTMCYLNGDTKLKAVKVYLGRLEKNEKLSWPKSQKPNLASSDAFRVDPGGEHLECFQFYRLKKQA
jgi:hypothetical protein